MRIDSTIQMYNTFQACRTVGLKAYEEVNLLIDILERVKQKRKLLVELPKSWVQQNQRQYLAVPRFFKRRNNALSDANQKLFTLIDTGTHDLKGFCTAENYRAMRILGYAFHVLPRLLWEPEKFSPDFFAFNFRIASNYWEDLSSDLKQALCDVLGLTLEQATALINTEGYEIDG